RGTYGKAQTLKPSNPNSGAWYVALLFVDNRLNEALEALEAEAKRDPSAPAPRISIALYSLAARQYVNAVRSATRARELQPGIPFASALEIWARVRGVTSEREACMNLHAG